MRTPAAVTRFASLTGRLDLLALGLALLLGALLRFVGLGNKSFWTDELYVVWEGRQPLDLIFDPQLHIQHPPGYRLALHMWMGAGLAESWIRLLPALCGLLLIPVVWALARALWPNQHAVAIIAALLVGTSPFLLHYSQDATTYSWSTLWLSVSFLLLVYAWRSDRLWLWVAWSVSLALSLYGHYFNFFPLVIEGLAVVKLGLRGGSAARRLMRHALVAIGGAVLLYSPWLWVLLSGNGGQLAIPLFPLTFDKQLLHWLPTLLAGYAHEDFWQSTLAVAALWLALLAGLGLVVWWRWKEPSTRSLALLGGWAVAATVGPYVFLRLTTPPTDTDPVRFAAMSAPALLLGIAWLVAQLPPGGRVALALGWLILAGAQWQAEYFGPPTQDWRGVLSEVAAGAQSDDAFLAFPAFHAAAAAAYYPEPLAVEGGWFTGDGETPNSAAYWFPVGWRWKGFLASAAERSTDWSGEIEARTSTARRLWYLAGDGTDGNYVPSPAAERTLTSLGWHLQQQWHASPLVLQLYTRSGG